MNPDRLCNSLKAADALLVQCQNHLQLGITCLCKGRPEEFTPMEHVTHARESIACIMRALLDPASKSGQRNPSTPTA
jgi:hypothetical protein